MSKQVKSFVRTIKSSYPVSPTADDFNKVYFLQKDANSTSGYIKTGGKDYGNGIVSAAYNSSAHKITFTLADGTSTSEIDCSSFLVDGMVEDVKLITIKNYTSSDSYVVGDFVNSGHQIYECIKKADAGTTFSSEYFTLKSTQDISAGNYLYVDFNTASGKQDIFIPLTDIFNPANYVAKAASIGSGYLMQMDASGNAVNSGKKTTDFANAIHTHGNITNDGKVTEPAGSASTAPSDILLVARMVDNQEGKVYRSGIKFDGSTTTTALTPKGTFETFLQSHQDISGKADKVSDATADNFAGLDSNGNLKDSGKKASNFATDAQGIKADSAIQGVKVNGTALDPDANKVVNIPIATTSREGVVKIYNTQQSTDGSKPNKVYSAEYVDSIILMWEDE